MNKVNLNHDENLVIAQNYYRCMLDKNFDAMAAYLHQDVHFISPLAELSEKIAVVEAAKKLSTILQNIEIRAQFSSEDHIMFAYDFIFPEPIGMLRSAVLIKFVDQQISRIELFYDGRPFEESKGMFSPKYF